MGQSAGGEDADGNRGVKDGNRSAKDGNRSAKGQSASKPTSGGGENAASSSQQQQAENLARDGAMDVTGDDSPPPYSPSHPGPQGSSPSASVSRPEAVSRSPEATHDGLVSPSKASNAVCENPGWNSFFDESPTLCCKRILRHTADGRFSCHNLNDYCFWHFAGRGSRWGSYG